MPQFERLDFMTGWRIKRSGAVMRVYGRYVCYPSGEVTDNFRLTGVSAVEVMRGNVVAVSKEGRVLAVLRTTTETPGRTNETES